MRNRQARIRFPVFSGYEVRVIFARDLAATGRRLQTDLTDCVAAFVEDAAFPKRGWLVLPLEPDEATVAHESSHAVRALLAFSGARNDNETFAYHLDYLVGRIHKAIKRGRNVDLSPKDGRTRPQRRS